MAADQQCGRSQTGEFVSKIPRLRCSLSGGRGSVSGNRSTTPAPATQMRNVYNDTSNVKPQLLNGRGSFNNRHSHTVSHFNSQKTPNHDLKSVASVTQVKAQTSTAPQQQAQSSYHKKLHQKTSSIVKQYMSSPTRGAAGSGSNTATPAQTQALLEMNEKIKKQNQMYIQEKL